MGEGKYCVCDKSWSTAVNTSHGRSFQAKHFNAFCTTWRFKASTSEGSWSRFPADLLTTPSASEFKYYAAVWHVRLGWWPTYLIIFPQQTRSFVITAAPGSPCTRIASLCSKQGAHGISELRLLYIGRLSSPAAATPHIAWLTWICNIYLWPRNLGWWGTQFRL